VTKERHKIKCPGRAKPTKWQPKYSRCTASIRNERIISDHQAKHSLAKVCIQQALTNKQNQPNIKKALLHQMPVSSQHKAVMPQGERRDRTESPNSKCRMKWKSKSTSNRKITKWRETANFLCTAKSEPWPSDQPVQTTQSAKKLNHEISGWSHRSHFPWPSQSLTCLRHFLQQA